MTLRRSKTDQAGAGREVAIPQLRTEALCPVHALRTWLTAAAIVEGPVFRTFSMRGGLQGHRLDGRDVARFVQRLTGRARLEGDFAAHSLRISTAQITRQSYARAVCSRSRNYRFYPPIRGITQGYTSQAPRTF